MNWQSVYVNHYVLQCFAICSGIPVSLRTSLNRRFGFDSQSLAEEVSGQSHHFVAILKGVEMGIRPCLMAILLGDSYPTHMWFDCFVSYKVDITNQSCAATSWWFQIVIGTIFLLQIIYYSCQRFTYYPWSMYVDTSGSVHGNKMK